MDETEQEHIKLLEQVFLGLNKFQLKLNPEKFVFLQQEVNFLGYNLLMYI